MQIPTFLILTSAQWLGNVFASFYLIHTNWIPSNKWSANSNCIMLQYFELLNLMIFSIVFQEVRCTSQEKFRDHVIKDLWLPKLWYVHTHMHRGVDKIILKNILPVIPFFYNQKYCLLFNQNYPLDARTSLSLGIVWVQTQFCHHIKILCL